MGKNTTGLKMGDGTIIGTDVLGCLVASYNEDGSFKNFQIITAEGHKINLESGDNIAVKPMGNLQHDTAHYASDADKNEFKMKAICDDKNHVEGYNIEAAGVKFITQKADTSRGWDPGKWVLKIQESAKKFARAVIHASSWDIRTRATAPGTGGGIALQTASCDSDLHENKLKHETDRKVDVELGLPTTKEQWAEFYNGEGGNGIELFTSNSQFVSRYANEYRFKRLGRIFAVTRKAPVTVADKTDYPTNPADDSKDFKVGRSITTDELVRGILYLIDNRMIQSSEALGLTTDIVE